MNDFNGRAVRRIFQNRNLGGLAFRGQCRFAIRLFVHIFVTDISGIFIDAQIAVYLSVLLSVKQKEPSPGSQP